MPAFLFAGILLLPLSARSSIRKNFRLCTTPASLALIHLILLLEGVSRLGPSRTLLAASAAPHLTQKIRRRRPKTAALVSFIALLSLALVVHDATGGGARVSERVLKSRAGHAVSTRLHKISRSVGQRVRDNKPLKRLRERYGVPPKPPQPDDNPDHHHSAKRRRRLLALVKAEELIPDQAQDRHEGSATSERMRLNRKAEDPTGVSTRRTSSAAIQTGSISNATHSALEKDEVANSKSRLNETDTNNSITGRSIQGTARHTALLGVVFVVLSSAAGSAASDARLRVAHDADDVSAVYATIFLTAAFLLLPFAGFFSVSAAVRNDLHVHALFSEVAPCGGLVGLGVLAFPVILHVYRSDGGQRGRGQTQRTSSKVNILSSLIRSSSSMLAEVGGLSGVTAYSYVCASILMLRKISISTFGFKEALSFSSYLAALLLFFISVIDSPKGPTRGQFDSGPRDRAITGSSGNPAGLMDRNTVHRLRHLWRSICTALSVWLTRIRDLVIHARLNKASWQVLNFLVLQSGMATVELIYASMTHSSGLISISADNFFCCIALAIGLQAIRITTRKPTNVYTYGFSRFESVCGFANGIMLIFVAVLIVIEAFERFNDTDDVAVGQTFTVCLFGMTGNILGLYFFPPESRRENHNVQGIYLHIWANTLAFASMAVSTAITAAVPVWNLIDIITATLAAVGIIALAIPLLVRSGRLLLLLVPIEKLKSLMSVKDRLNNIDGVVKVSGLRVWNLSPNCLVASVRLKVADYHRGPDVEVLYKARSVFASMGVPASQCTIQISRVPAETKAVVFFHKRSHSGFGDTGIDLEAMSTSRESIEQQTQTN